MTLACCSLREINDDVRGQVVHHDLCDLLSLLWLLHNYTLLYSCASVKPIPQILPVDLRALYDGAPDAPGGHATFANHLADAEGVLAQAVHAGFHEVGIGSGEP